MEKYFLDSHVSPDVLCLHCESAETQPLRPNAPGLRLQHLANKNIECLVISAKTINKIFSVYPLQYSIRQPNPTLELSTISPSM